MFRSYAITVRPYNGISDKTIDAYVKWFEKLDYAFIAIEKEGWERHLHAQIWTDVAKAKGDIIKQVERICVRTIDDWDQAQKKVLRGGVKIAYSDWYLDYLAENDLKIDDPNILYSHLPENTYDYYPTEEEQDKVKTISNAVDQRFTDLEFKCLEYLDKHSLPINLKTTARFLSDAMFSDRTIKVLMHQRDRCALATTLYAFISKSNDTDLFISKSAVEKREEQKFLELKNKILNYQFDNSDTEE